MEVIWSDFAVESLSDIFVYVQGFFGKRTAHTTARKVIDFVESLSDAPQQGKQLLHLSQFGEVRCAFYKQNHIYYLIIENRIEIILIWDGRQDPKRLQHLLVDFLMKK